MHRRRRARVFRHVRRSLSFALVLLAITTVLPAIPAIAAVLSPLSDTVASADPAHASYQKASTPPPLTDAQRLPVVDLSGLPGIWPNDVVAAYPGSVAATSPSGAVAGDRPLPAAGAPGFDAFANGTTRNPHAALIYPQDVNVRQPDGTYQRAVITLSSSPAGWGVTDPAGATSLLPANLSAATPVTIQAASGSLSLAPSTGASTGSASGITVTYPGAMAGGDLVYTPALEGLQESIVFSAAPTTPVFDFTLTAKGLALSPNTAGGIDVTSAGAWVATLPAPVAYDASPGRAQAVGAYTLARSTDGSYSLSASFDPAYFAAATYPVTVDPSWNDIPTRDGYTDSGSPSTSFESSSYLKVDTGMRSYLKFDISSLLKNGRLVYAAQLDLYPTATGGVTGGIDAKRVTAAWPATGTLNWNNQPALGTSVFDNQADTCSGCLGWWSWDITKLYQQYIDTSTYSVTDYGVALTASSPKTFYSVESINDPVLYVLYNDLPNAPTLDAPSGGYVSGSDSLTLSADKIPSDPNGDDVLIRFEVSDDGVNWTGNHLIFFSPWSDNRKTTVPGGLLLDGHSYSWRAVARDVCSGTSGLCPLQDGTGATRDPSSSGVRSLTISLKLKRPGFHGDFRPWKWRKDHGNQTPLIEALPTRGEGASGRSGALGDRTER